MYFELTVKQKVLSEIYVAVDAKMTQLHHADHVKYLRDH